MPQGSQITPPRKGYGQNAQSSSTKTALARAPLKAWIGRKVTQKYKVPIYIVNTKVRKMADDCICVYLQIFIPVRTRRFIIPILPIVLMIPRRRGILFPVPDLICSQEEMNPPPRITLPPIPPLEE